MPLVVVSRNPQILSDDQARRLGPDLQKIVAEALDGNDEEGSRLKPEEIEVRFRDNGPLDVNSSPFAVEVFANEYPSRKEDLEARVGQIARELRVHPAVPPSVIDDKGGFVWVMLAPAGFELL